MELIRTWDGFAWAPFTPENTRLILFNHLFEFISFLPIIFLQVYGYKWTIKGKNIVLLASLTTMFAVLGPLLVAFFLTRLKLIFLKDNYSPITLKEIEMYVPGCIVVILFLCVTYYLTHLKLQNDKQREVVHRVETSAKEVQLKMLRYQINPHFLFNVLNSIHALIDENKDKAKKLVVEMSEYYRYTLNKQQLAIPIEEEVEAVVKYLEIQKTRFEEGFQYEVSTDKAANKVLIPPFVIHLLMENAVKYGLISNEQKLDIHLSVKLSNKLLLINVLNTGKLMDAVPLNEKNINGTGNGIENIKNRLALFYDNNYSFSLTEENGWVIASIEIKNIQIQ